MTETLTWHPADGDPFVLSSAPTKWLRRVAGRGMPPIEVTDRPNRAGAGGILEQIRDGVRTVEVPILVTGQIRSNLRDLADAFDTGADGRLVAEHDSESRQLECRYVGGLEWDERIPTAQMALVVFRAWRPYWEDVDPTTETFQIGGLGTWLPWEMGTAPIRTVADNIFAEATIVNDGNVQAWPVWTLDGPFTSVILRDEDADAVLEVDYTATSSEQLIIDTRPGRKTVRDQDGVSRFDLLDDVNDTFFPLRLGTTVVAIELAGATAESQVTLEWRRRWKTA